VDAYRFVEALGAEQDGVVTARQCLEVGLSRGNIVTLCRKKRMRRMFWGTYLVNADYATEIPIKARIRSAMLSAGDDCVAVEGTAAHLLGIAGGPPGDHPVRLAYPPELARRQRIVDLDLRYSQLTLEPGEIVQVDGLRVTSAVRTVADLLRTTDRLTAVSVVDSALSRGLLQVADLPAVVEAMGAHRWSVRAQELLFETDGRAESPLESRSRLRARDGGVPPDDLQVDIHDANGQFVARVDMLWRAGRLIGEADGAEFHERPAALFRDRERQNALIALGYRIVRFTWKDTVRPGDVPAMIRAALSSRP
jgi:hypothetical protein